MPKIKAALQLANQFVTGSDRSSNMKPWEAESIPMKSKWMSLRLHHAVLLS